MGETSLRYVVSERSPYGNPELVLDLAEASVVDLFFSCFMGDVDLTLDGVKFRTNFGWVSTLGFALAFQNVVSGLQATDEQQSTSRKILNGSGFAGTMIPCG